MRIWRKTAAVMAALGMMLALALTAGAPQKAAAADPAWVACNPTLSGFTAPAGQVSKNTAHMFIILPRTSSTFQVFWWTREANKACSWTVKESAQPSTWRPPQSSIVGVYWIQQRLQACSGNKYDYVPVVTGRIKSHTLTMVTARAISTTTYATTTWKRNLNVPCGWIKGTTVNRTAAQLPGETYTQIVARTEIKPTVQKSPYGAGKYLVWIQTKNQVLAVDNGIIVKTMPTTDLDWKTPVGDYKILRSAHTAYSSAGWRLDNFMPFRLRPGQTEYIGLHALPYKGTLPNANFIMPESEIGKPGYASSGCLRLKFADARYVATFAPAGTVIKVR